jgi:hypothetical protein
LVGKTLTISLNSPDLAPSDIHLFPKLKEFLGGKRMATDESFESEECFPEQLTQRGVQEYEEFSCKLSRHMLLTT